MAGDPTRASQIQELLNATPDLVEYGTVAVGANGQITIPKAAREELGVAASRLYYLYGSPALGIGILLGQRGRPADMLRFSLEQPPRGPEEPH